MSDDFDDGPSRAIETLRAPANRNPFRSGQEVAPRANGAGGAIAIEQDRAVAEVQARMMIARRFPRDPIKAMDAILKECTRPTLAESALYQFNRGGSSISGPSIRLAETIARNWGNIADGIKEISRGHGYSECVAYAWDLETGYYDERVFQVRHWRDTKSGGYQLTDERDIYELIANMGQRRKRAVLLTVMPGDIVEAAVEECNATLRTTADTSPAALKKIADAFGAYGVTQKQLETRCGCRLEAIRPAQVVQLRKIFASLKDEMSKPEDWFGPSAVADVEDTDQEKPEPRLRKRIEKQAATEDDGTTTQDDDTTPSGAIRMPMRGEKQANWQAYFDLCAAALKEIQDIAGVDEWVARNEATYKKSATYAHKIGEAVDNRRRELAPPKADPIPQRVDDLVGELEKIDGAAMASALDELLGRAATGSVQRAVQDRPELLEKLSDAIYAARQRVIP